MSVTLRKRRAENSKTHVDNQAYSNKVDEYVKEQAGTAERT